MSPVDPLYVFTHLPSDIDGPPVLVGRIVQQQKDSYVLNQDTFTYARSYAENSVAFALCPELPLTVVPQTLTNGRRFFGAFLDVAPDKWGRTLLYKEEARVAVQEQRRMAQVSDLWYVSQVSDDVRMGALRFRTSESLDEGKWLSDSREVPFVVSLMEIAQANAQAQDSDVELDWEKATLLFGSGTALGGARPKAVVRDGGQLKLAKFPQNQDRWNVEVWEYVIHRLAARAGIQVPRVEYYPLDEFNNRGALILDRFDRSSRGGRYPYISADTLLSKGEWEEITYSELARTVTQNSPVPGDGEELFARVALTLLVNNIDDHMRNTGFIRVTGGWKLAPLFDVTPFPQSYGHDGTLVCRDPQVGVRSMFDLVAEAQHYRLRPQKALEVLKRVVDAVSAWELEAKTVSLDHESIEHMRTAFEGVALSEAKYLLQAEA